MTRFLLLAFLLSACAAEPALDSALDVPVVTSLVAEAPGLCTLDAEPEVTIGTADGPPETQLFRVFGATRLTDGRVAVVNQGTQELRFYSPEGDYLGAVGRSGEGPGEFKRAFLVWRTLGDSLWVGDYRPWEYEVFDSSGSWARGVRLKPDMINPPQPLGVLRSGYSIASVDDPGGLPTDFEPQMVTVVAFDPSGSRVDTLGRFEGNRYGQVMDDPGSLFVSPMFGAGFAMSVGPDHIALGNRGRAAVDIYAGHPGFDFIRTIAWDIEPRAVTRAHIDAERARIQEGASERTPEEYRLFVEPRLHADRPVADTFPAIGAIEFGADGTLWIRTYRKRVEREVDGDLWLAFGRDGSLKCTMETPILHIAEIGADYLLVESEGDEGEELVQLYRLRFGD